MNTKEFADKWGCSQATVRRWCKEKKINAYQYAPYSPYEIKKDEIPPMSYLKRKKLL